MKNIIVCMKQVLDPEIPLSLFSIDAESKRAMRPKATPPVLSPFDENALEAALKIKDTQAAEITVISLGKKLTKAVVTSALAAGADRLVLLQDEVFDEFNTYLTARAIAAAIKKLEKYDLILCGLQAADTNAGQVGIGIANVLGLHCITAASKVEIVGDEVRVEQPTSDGSRVIGAPTPVVVTTSYEAGTLREPGVEAFMAAAQKPITTWSFEDLDIIPDKTDLFSMVQMNKPSQDKQCQMMEGSGPEEKAASLLAKLKEIKLV